MKSFCQFVLLSVLAFFQGCAWLNPQRPSDAELLQRVDAKWFGFNPGIRLAGWNGELEPHLFYDADPGLSVKNFQVNFIPLALAGGHVAFALDPLSGQRFFSHFFCAQDNVWGEAGRVSARPSFTYGIVPRYFDRLNNPQQIIVFGGSVDYDVRSPVVHQVRVIGGLVMEECATGSCSGATDWAAKIVLVAVNDDGAWKNVRTIKELQEKMDWADVRAELETHQGRNSLGEQTFPAAKAGNLLEAKAVLEHLQKNSLLMTEKELLTVNRSCAGIYDRLWKEVGMDQPEDAAVETSEQVKQFMRLQEEAKKSKKPWLFSGRLAAFLKREGQQLATCSRVVYPGDPNADRGKFWFTTWMTMYVRLHKEGFAFNCSRRSWSEENTGADAMKSLIGDAQNCKNSDYDKAMSEMPVFMRTLRGSKGQEWRYVSWDEGAQGSHAKLYNWVQVPARVFKCGSDLNAPVRAKWQTRPEEGTWKRRHQENKSGRGDIYVL